MERNRCGKYGSSELDAGSEPLVFNIDHTAIKNRNYRTTIWTGEHLQLTLMSIPCGTDIGLEIHRNVDQFIYIVSGRGLVKTGKCENDLRVNKPVNSESSIIIPAGTWHNIVNIGKSPLKLYSIYAPTQHPAGTVHRTKEEAELSGD